MTLQNLYILACLSVCIQLASKRLKRFGQNFVLLLTQTDQILSYKITEEKFPLERQHLNA